VKTAILHYSAPPVIGGVEAVMQAHAEVFLQNGVDVTLIAGRGAPAALPKGAGWVEIAELDTRHPLVEEITSSLNQGRVPAEFGELKARLHTILAEVLPTFDHVFVHNIFSKHFNLPLTAALADLAAAGQVPGCIAWCHDFTWSSPNSRHKVFPGQPWDLLRSQLPGVRYVVVSRQRLREFAEITDRPLAEVAPQVPVIYNGVDLPEVLGLTPEGTHLAAQLGLPDADLVLLMPVRVTQAKNIEFALELTAALKNLGVRPKLVVTGPPDPHSSQSMAYFESLQAQRARLGLQEQAHFVYETAPDEASGRTIDLPVVYDLLRCADIMLMPSHREGFGMPVLEAGLAGVPVVVSAAVPAAEEIARDDLALRLEDQSSLQAARQVLDFAQSNPGLHFRRRVRQQLTWQALYERQIKPLLQA
jgi:glycosyltransferase involved in cell wall biosynthesis